MQTTFRNRTRFSRTINWGRGHSGVPLSDVHFFISEPDRTTMAKLQRRMTHGKNPSWEVVNIPLFLRGFNPPRKISSIHRQNQVAGLRPKFNALQSHGTGTYEKIPVVPLKIVWLASLIDLKWPEFISPNTLEPLQSHFPSWYPIRSSVQSDHTARFSTAYLKSLVETGANLQLPKPTG